jgi:hypothetical protein
MPLKYTIIMKHPFSFLFVFLVTIAGCHDDETPIRDKTIWLDYHTESFQLAGGEFQVSTRVDYIYNEQNKLSMYTVLGYNGNVARFEEQQFFKLSYSGSKVQQIKGFLANAASPYVVYAYEYLADSRISKITQNNSSANVVLVANFSYTPASDSVKIVYTASNGAGFEYIFSTVNNNISADKTTSASQTCSEGSYTYDKNRNPFNALGYIDFGLTNFSVNNKLSENVNYKACVFPQLVPLLYEYTYTEQGYPETVITTYKSSGSTTPRSRKDFFYK